MAQVEINLVEGRYLKRKDLFSESDPFAEMYLDKASEKQKSKVKKNTASPQWNEVFVL